MRTRYPRTLMTLGVAGIAMTALAVVRFLSEWAHNKLPWTPSVSMRDFYLEVGERYTEGFAIGFFMAVSLVAAFYGIAMVVGARRSADDSGRDRGADQQQQYAHDPVNRLEGDAA